MLVHDLSCSMLGDPDRAHLTAAAEIRASIGPRDAFGAVGFAYFALAANGTGTTDPEVSPWIPLGPTSKLVSLDLPSDQELQDTIGSCANPSIGLRMAQHQLIASPAPVRAIVLVSDGPFNCVATDSADQAIPPLEAATRAVDTGFDVHGIHVWTLQMTHPNDTEEQARKDGRGMKTLVRGHGKARVASRRDLDQAYRGIAKEIDALR